MPTDDAKGRRDDFDHLFYVRIFEGCNLYCEHCFIPSNPKKMSRDQIIAIPDIIKRAMGNDRRVLIQWHGGEPTMFGAQWLEEAIETVNSSLTDYEVRHGIQTNLMTYSAEWADVYKHYFNSEVGVSWDPEIRHSRKGREGSNGEYESVFWEKFGSLLSDGITPYLVVTGTKVFFDKFRNPFDFFDFLEKKGVRLAHIERITKTGYARENWGRVGVTNSEYSKNMANFLKCYVAWSMARQDGNEGIFISPFDGILESVSGLTRGEYSGYGCWSGKCDDRFHTIDASGYKSGCTAITSEYDNRNALQNNEFVVKFDDIKKARQIRKVDCQACDFRPICSSGCLAASDDGSGECSGGKGIFVAARKIIEECGYE